MQKKAQNKTPYIHQTFWFPALGAVLLLPFANGRWVVPAATWLGTAFLVRVMRLLPERRALTWGFLLFVAALVFQWWGAARTASGLLLGLGIASAGILSFIPFALDRILSSRIPGFRGTLILPLSWVIAEFLFSLMFANFGTIAYTQAGNLPLLQLASVTGTFGITFLIGWFASILNWAWQQDFRWLPIRKGLFGFAAVISLIYLGGTARLLLAPPPGPTIRAASITVDASDVASTMSRFLRQGGTLTDYDLKQAIKRMHSLNDALLEKTRREARAGARYVVWSEVNAHVMKTEEWSLFKKAQELSRKEGIYLFAGIATFMLGKNRIENKIVGFGPHGEILFEYFKSKLAPGELSIPGNGRLPTIETGFGKMSAAIQTDLAYHRFMRQAGIESVDTLVDASAEWKEIDPIHTQVAIFRAVENGFNLLKQTLNGRSVGVDYQGRVRAEIDYFQASEPVLVAQLPRSGVRTIYALVGDSFAWLCMMAFAALVIRVRRAKT